MSREFSAAPHGEFSVFSHVDLRNCLTDFVRTKRDRDRRFTLGRWARQLGIPHTATLTNYLKGRRKIPSPVFKKIASTVAGDSSANAYLDLLWNLTYVDGKAEFRREADRLRKKLVRTGERAKTKAQEKLLEEKYFSVVAFPEALIVLDAIRLGEKPVSIPELKKRLRFPATASELRSIVKKLEDSGLLIREGSTYRRVLPIWTTTAEIPSSSIRSFHSRSLRMAAELIDRIPVRDRLYTSYVFPMKAERMESAKKELGRWLEGFFARYSEDAADSDLVAQVNLNLLPMTVSPRKDTPREEARS